MRKFTVLLLCVCLGVTYGQDTSLVTGIVTTTSETPIQGATILVKGTFKETTTDVDGAFQIEANGENTLLISAFGMYSKEVSVDTFNLPPIKLAPVSEELGEVEINQKRTYEKKNVVGGSGIRRALGFSGDQFRELFVGEYDPDLFVSINNMPGIEAPIANQSQFGSTGNFRYLGISRFRPKGSTAPPPPATIIIDDVIAEQWQLNSIRPEMIVNIMIIEEKARMMSYSGRFGKKLEGTGVIVIDTIYGSMYEGEKELPSLLSEGNDYENDAISMNQAMIKPDYLLSLEQATSFEEARSIHQKQLNGLDTASLPFFLDTAHYFRKWDAKYSEGIMDQLYRMGKENSKVLLGMAYHYEKLGELGKATYLYQELIEMRPERIQSYRNLAHIYAQTGKFELANSLYKQMLFNSIANVDFTPIEAIVINEYRNYLSRHKTEIDYSDLPSELLIAGFKKDVRMVFEWTDPMAQFELQMVSPKGKYYTWKHDEFDSRELLEEELKYGYGMKEFIIDDAEPGDWIINIEGTGEVNEQLPNYIKYTVFYNYGTPDETKQVQVVGLNAFDKKVTLDAISQNAAKSDVRKREKPQRILLYWDTSLNMRFKNHRKEKQLLASYLQLITSEGKQATVELVSFGKDRLNTRQFTLTSGNLNTLWNHLDAIDYNGPTDYSEILKENDLNAQIALVFSDGNSFAQEPKSELGIPVFCINSHPDANHVVLNDLAFYSGGYYIDLYSQTVDKGMEKLLTDVVVNEDYAAFKRGLDKNELVYGVIHNENGPIGGASVRVRNSFDEVRTGNNGMYRIRAAQGDVLQIKALGMISKDTVIGESKKMHILMEPDGELLDEVRVMAQKSGDETVKTPYGEKKKAAVGYSTRSVVTSDDIRPDQIELWQILQKMPGVIVEDPGGSNPRYKLRRTMEITIQGTTYPALVVDGMVYEQSGQQPYVNVQQIESVKVLNSLSATNRYGQLAAFGAIVIETKKGPAREPIAQQEIEKVKGNEYDEQVLSIETASMNAEKPNYLREMETAGDFESAKSLYYDILRQNNLPSVSFFLDVGRYFRKWNAEFSNQVLSNITEIAPNNTKALKSLAYTFESFSEDALATPLYERIVNLQPAEVQSYLDLARNYKRVGEYQMSATLYKQMVANSIPKVDFNDVGVVVFNEFKQLIALHKSKIDFSDIPNELMKVGFKKDLRLVVEWNDPMADFELQFITPSKKYFPYVHNLYGDQEMLKKEMEQGFSIKEFDIEDADRGKWTVNVKYSGTRDELNPTILKYTLYRNFGLTDEERIIKTVKLQDFDGKVTLDSFVY